MNTNLLNAPKEIISKYGGVGTLSDARRVKALLADLAANEPKPQKNALTACIEHGFVPALQNVSAGERGAAKAKLAERLNREEGLEPVLCADTLDLLEAALFGEKPPEQTKALCQKCGKELQTEWKICPYCMSLTTEPDTSQTAEQTKEFPAVWNTLPSDPPEPETSQTAEERRDFSAVQIRPLLAKQPAIKSKIWRILLVVLALIWICGVIEVSLSL
jgi:hypothetical protein